MSHIERKADNLASQYQAMTIDFKYKISDEVRIKAINALGQVDGLMVDVQGIMYRVVFWDGGVRNSVWMYDWELWGS